MPRLKKKSAALPNATKRLSGMRSIDPKLDFGAGFSNAAFAKMIRSKLRPIWMLTTRCSLK